MARKIASKPLFTNFVLTITPSNLPMFSTKPPRDALPEKPLRRVTIPIPALVQFGYFVILIAVACVLFAYSHKIWNEDKPGKATDNYTEKESY